MNRFGNFFKPLKWCMALVLAAVVAGCGGGDDGGGGLGPGPGGGVTQTPAGGVCTSGTPACVPLATAETFAILARDTITDVPTSPITGHVGVSPGSGAAILVTCAEVSGTIFQVDAGYAGGGDPDISCAETNPTLLTSAAGTGGTGDMVTAYNDATGRAAGTGNFLEHGAGTLGSETLVSGVYTWAGNVNIANNLTLSGGANEVWIFQIGGTLGQAAGVTVTLSGGAKAQNIFWAVAGATTILPSAHFEGIIISPSSIALQTGATMNGRMFSATQVTLQSNTVSRPAN